MTARRLAYYPISDRYVQVIEGGAAGLANLIDSGEWKRAEPDALLIAKGTLERGTSLYVFDTDDFVRLIERLLQEGVDLTDSDVLQRSLNLDESAAAQQLDFRPNVLHSPDLEPPAVLLAPSGEPAGVVLHTRRPEPAFVRPRGHLEVPAEAAKLLGRETEEVVRRTPHLDLSTEALGPNVSFEVEVYADRAPARDDEQSEDIVLEDPAGQPLLLDVWLVASSHFEIPGSVTGTLTITPDQERSSSATFKLAVAHQVDDVKRASITALFAHNGRPCGRVFRRVRLSATTIARPRRSGRPPAPPASLRLEPGARGPDMVIEISDQTDGDGVRYPFKVTVYRDEKLVRPPVTGTWTLPTDTGKLVKDVMGDFTQANASPGQRIDALVGAGIELFKLAPTEFQALLWKLVAAKQLPETIYIVSSEPYVPWELMVPNRERAGGQIEKRSPLGVEFVIGRWIERDHRSPAQAIAMSHSSVVAPAYVGPRALALADEEATFVCDKFHGERLSPSDYDQLKGALQTRASTLLHFACHGAASATQAIYLDPNEAKLSSSTLRGMLSDATAFRSCRPLVFINACEVGRPQPTLVGTGGFAEVLIDAAASGVVAPLWSVRSSIAHDVAHIFYDQVSTPGVRFAEALRELRRKAYEDGHGEDTYAAYCYYGDPNAAQQPLGASDAPS